ncbi:lipid IV(A) 4-amino-4-deoxy-L-arabinosyltransferase [Pseudomonas sp. HR96]|uniref:lipid IV(A) 4-amino-4-deoxy-L-arabinosyltransferase n=1 Tax=Pseudomonas sp. HR96 TaxID=1027966 RepID=UPI002A74A01B|nr:lipid IV(A) 4-amino-4-deoxy-L-arabinosyltransferase [Pseudomonas sp. HR96]WPO97599.1 lipid IV(A) 4-amino-4-deoxy-L-arabinosyltransferase [Pseudomonas sp. HR96]
MTQRWALPLLILAFVLFYLAPLGSHGLWIPDETRYAQASQEMLLSGHWATPHFMGLRYFEKPAAGYWMIALGQAVFGQTLFGVRIASALSLGLSVLLAYAVAGRLWRDARTRLACAAVYMSLCLIAAGAGYANLDPQFSAWLNLSIAAGFYASDSERRRQRLAAWAVLGLAAGMAFMTKGFLALLLPVLVIAPYLIWQRRFLELVGYGSLAMLVAVLVALPWALTIHTQEPDFWRYFFWDEHIRRFAGNDAQHAAPFWYYLPLLALSSLPWLGLLPGTFAQGWRQRGDHRQVFVWLWLLLPFLFFSMAKGKLPSYIMPCMLPLGLLLGRYLVTLLEQGATQVLRRNAALNLTLGVAGLLALAFFQFKQPIYVNEPAHLLLLLLALGAWTLGNALSLWRPARLWAAPAVAMGALLALAPAALPDKVVVNKTPDVFIAEHAGQLRSAHSLLSNELGTASALAWHTGKPDITLFNTSGETNYGMRYPDAQGRAVGMDQVRQWLRAARKAGPVGVAMRVKSSDEQRELALLPADGQRYEQGSVVIVLYDRLP